MIRDDILEKDEIDKHIGEWYRLSIGQTVDQSDTFFRFVAVWVAFNAFYSSRMKKEYGDRKQVMAYARESDVIDLHSKLLKEDQYYKNAVCVLKGKGVYNTSDKRRCSIDKIENLSQVAQCIYQVRCNLFHGGKAPTDLRDQSLVDASYIITSRIVEHALKIP